MKKIAFIFDMDGTMVDNMAWHLLAWQATLRDMGLDWPLEQVREQVHGRNEEIFARIFGERLSPQEAERWAEVKEARYRWLYRPRLCALPGLMEFLGESIGQGDVALGIGTMAPRANADFVLQGLGLRGIFDAVVTAEDVQRGKPAPDIFLLAAERLGIAPESCLVFEDAPSGAAAAHAAKMPCIMLSTNQAPESLAVLDGVRQVAADYDALSVEMLRRYLR